MIRVTCVVVARDEEAHIAEAIESLRGQVNGITLVDDGSLDSTAIIAKAHGCKVVTLPYHKENLAGTPLLADRFNLGFKLAKDADYIMVAGSDDQFPPNYVETIVGRMESNPRIAIASGQAKGEETEINAPRGSGRIIRGSFWRGIGGPIYPRLWCWEEWVVYKALQLGLEAWAYPDIRFKRRRQGKRSRRKLVGDGRACYALGCSPLYMVGRIAKVLFKSPRAAVYTFTGYIQAWFNGDEQADVNRWLRQYQRQRVATTLTRHIKFVLNASWTPRTQT